MKFHLKDPSDVIIEKTAGNFAGLFFDAARSSGMGIIMLQGQQIDLRKYKNNPRNFARVHLEKFIPAAIEALTTILANPKTPLEQRDVIYNALMERVNDTTVIEMGKAASLPEFENSPLYKTDTEKPKPVIINTPKIDFDYDSKRTT